MYWPENEFRTIDRLRHIPQEEDWDCGVAVYTMALLMSRLVIPNRSILVTELNAAYETGTTASNLALLAKKQIPGTLEIPGASICDIEKSLRLGRSCLVDYQSVASVDLIHKGKIICDFKSLEPVEDFEWGHYVIIVDQDKTGFYIRDSALINGVDGLLKGVRRVPKTIFDARWIDKEINGPVVDHWMIEI